MKKKIIYLALFSFLAITVFHSCEDEDTIRFNLDEFGQGFLPFFDWAEGSDNGFDQSDLTTASVTVLVDLRAQETENLASEANNVSEIQLKVVFDNLISPLDAPDTGIVATITEWPAEVTITPQDMVDALDSLGSTSDMAGGDKFTLTQHVVMKDGSVIDGIDAQNTVEVFDSAGNSLGNLTYDIYDNDLQINESGKNVYDWTFFLNCASNYDGDYTLTTTGNSGGIIGAPADFTSEFQVSLSLVGPGVYECPACLGGAMEKAYGAFGGDLVTGSFIILCDNTIQPAIMNDGWNPIRTYEGSIDPNTGVITVDWTNWFGDYGSAIYTPN